MRRLLLTWLAVTSALTLTICPSAHGQLSQDGDKNALRVRTQLDGSGPSHLIAYDSALLVLDPNDGLLRRYPISETGEFLDTIPTTCSMERDFSPRYFVLKESGVEIFGEARAPGKVASNSALPTLLLSRERLRRLTKSNAQGAVDSCGAESVGQYVSSKSVQRHSAGLQVNVPKTEGSDSTRPIIVQSKQGELYNARYIGHYDHSSPAIVSRELGMTNSGRIDLALWVSVYKNGVVSSVRVFDYDKNKQSFAGVIKRGFDFLAVANKTLYAMGAICKAEEVCIRRFELQPAVESNRNDPSNSALVLLNSIAIDQEDPSDSSDTLVLVPSGSSASAPDVSRWTKELYASIQKYSLHHWKYPSERRSVPCLANASGTCEIEGGTKMKWVGPRHLILPRSLLPDQANDSLEAWEIGIPYSYGSAQTPDEFDAGLISSEHVFPVGDLNGAIRSTGIFPLGIDCSAFVARVYGRKRKSTAKMVIEADSDELRSVANLASARTGDIFVKKGHVVIFSRTLWHGGNRFIEVYEAASRCGRVCRSVYDADYFNGWRIYRYHWLRRDDSPRVENPFWNDNGFRYRTAEEQND